MLSTHRRRTLLVVILAAGAVLRFWSVGFGLPNDLARPDEEKIATAALGILGGDLNPHFFLYPSLFIYLTAGAYEMGSLWRHIAGTTVLAAGIGAHTMDASSLYLAARVVSVVSGVATIGALYGAARELFNDRTALAGAALLAVTFLHVRDSHFGVTDVPVTLLVVLAFWAAARCFTRGVTLRRLAVTGAICGLAASTKYNAALVLMPAVVAIASHVDRRRRASLIQGGQAMAVLAGTSVVGFLIGTPFAVLDRRAFLADLDAQRQTALGTRHGSILDAARHVLTESGWVHHLRFSLRFGLGVPLLVVAFVGVVWLIAMRRRDAAIVLAFPVLFLIAMGDSQLAYARWMVPVVPFLCLTAGVAIDRLATLVASTTRLRYAPAVASMAMVLSAGVPTLAQSIAFDRLMARTDTRVLGARWIESELPAGATLYQTGMLYGHLEPRPVDHYPQCGFDDRSGRFTNRTHAGTALPDVVVVLESPLTVFDGVPSRLSQTLDHDYVLGASFTGIDSERGRRAVYDQQDAFYAPFDGFSGISTPGPGVRIFLRRSPAVHLISTCGAGQC
jgi:4-amino-4-deoxy-L-arabinose transferase-like glycosyltransferase